MCADLASGDLATHLKLVVSNPTTPDTKFPLIGRLLSDTFSGAGVIISQYVGGKNAVLAEVEVLSSQQPLISQLLSELQKKHGTGYRKLDILSDSVSRIIGMNLFSSQSRAPIGCFMVAMHLRSELSREDQKRLVVGKEFIQEHLLYGWQGP